MVSELLGSMSLAHDPLGGISGSNPIRITWLCFRKYLVCTNSSLDKIPIDTPGITNTRHNDKVEVLECLEADVSSSAPWPQICLQLLIRSAQDCFC